MIPCALTLLTVFVGQPTELESFFERFAAKHEHIKILHGRYRQEDFVPDDSLVTEGALFMQEPRRILFRADESGNTILVDGRYYYDYQPDLKQLEIKDLIGQSDQPEGGEEAEGESPAGSITDIFFFGFDGDTEALRKTYDVDLLANEIPGNPPNAMRIRPKVNHREESFFQEVRVYLSAETMLPKQIHIVYDEESQTVIDILQYNHDAKPDPKLTQINALEGTKVIQDNIVIEQSVPKGGMRFPKTDNLEQNTLSEETTSDDAQKKAATP